MDDEWLRSAGNHIVSRGDADFPELLERIPRPPDRLYVKGDPDLLHMPALAIVGSRNPTESGRRTAYEFARHLGAAGFCIVSGLAEGIDEVGGASRHGRRVLEQDAVSRRQGGSRSSRVAVTITLVSPKATRQEPAG